MSVSLFDFDLEPQGNSDKVVVVSPNKGIETPKKVIPNFGKP